MRNRMFIVTLIALICLAIGAGSAFAACDKGTTKSCKSSMKSPKNLAGDIESLADDIADVQEELAQATPDSEGYADLSEKEKALRAELAEKSAAYKAASAKAHTEMKKAEAAGDNNKARRVAVKYQEKLADQDKEVEEIMQQTQANSQ